MAGWQPRHLIVLLVGFSASFIVSSTFVGPSLAYQTQPIVQQMLIVFLLPTTATLIYFIIRCLQKRQQLVADAMTPDPAVQSIVFWILLFLIGVHLMVLTVLVGVRAVQPWASRAVVMLGGLTLVASAISCRARGPMSCLASALRGRSRIDACGCPSIVSAATFVSVSAFLPY